MEKRKQIEEILLNDYGCFDDFTVDKLLDLFSVVGQSEQLPCGDCKPIEYDVDGIRYFKCRTCGKPMK